MRERGLSGALAGVWGLYSVPVGLCCTATSGHQSLLFFREMIVYLSAVSRLIFALYLILAHSWAELVQAELNLYKLS